MSGFEYVATDGGDSGQRVRTYSRPATDAPLITIGDTVILNGTADADGTPQVVAIAADTSTAITGVVIGIEPDFTTEQLSIVGVPASTAAKLLVCDDPLATYIVDAETTLSITDVGSNIGIDYVATSASGVIYTSNSKIKTSTAGTAATLPFQIIELREDADGVLGNRALVRINASTVAPGATGV